MHLVTVKKHFSAAHRLYNPAFSKEWNEETFGVCTSKNWHGHNFELLVTVKGEVDRSGCLIARTSLENIIEDKIIHWVDHKNFNLDVPFMKGKLTSCENIIMEFWKILTSEIATNELPVDLHRLRLIETPRNFIDYYGD